jgi:hypothetical protein
VTTIAAARTAETAALAIYRAQDEVLTAEELREIADLLDLVGKTVVRTDSDGRRQVGTLTSVYMTDGLAANVEGLVDWSKNGKDYGRDFSMGPIEGGTITLCPDPWIGHKDGLAVKVYESRVGVDYDLAHRRIDGAGPYHQGGR